ncbi:MAG: nucleotidyltransferase, partial [Sphingobacteriaceae bacterium]
MTTLSYMQKQELGTFLERLAKSIDLTEAQYKEAAAKYEAVGSFLANPNCNLAPYNPQIRSQGSMRTGTVTRPIHPESEFDVDSTCWLSVGMPSLQYQIKKLVGDCFKSDGTYARMLDERKRCWRLNYADESRFHFDIVPAIPDDFQWLLHLGVPYKYAEHAVRITDNTDKDFYKVSSELPRSNPEGYALWFLDVMKVQADAIRMQLSAQLKMSVEQIPDYSIRTPLQRAVQLMKRHRDIMYENNDLKPISIIISTLAARAYSDVMLRNPGGLFYDIILEIAERMPSYIEKRYGISWITNPVNPNENFADKWQTDKKLEEHFFKWHKAFLETLRHE